MGFLCNLENNMKAVNIRFKVTIIYKSIKCTVILCFFFRISYMSREQRTATHKTDNKL